MPSPLAAPYSYFADSNGAPLASGNVYTYAAGTTTPKATYTDSTGVTPLANPVPLDSAGRAQIWLSGSYKIVVKDSLGNTISTADNITGTNSSAQIPWTVATGAADAITATYNPANTSLTDGLQLAFRASGANTTTTPTFAPDGLTAHTITQKGGSALVAGNITANLAEYLITYNLANTRWELLNPTPVTTTAVYSTAIDGCVISGITGTHTSAGFAVSAGHATDSTNASIITSAGYSWLATNGNAINGTDASSSTLANSTTYHVFLISGGSGTGTFVSASLTPTFPTGYTTYKRRIGSFNTDSSGNPLPYFSIESEGGATINWLTTQVLDINTATLSTSRVTFTLSVPTGIKVRPIMRVVTNASTGSILMTSGDETDVAPGANQTTAPQWDNGNASETIVGAQLYLTTNTSGQIGARSSSSSTPLYCTTRGWIDWRRA